MPVAEWLMALASQAGNAIVAAVATDAWEAVRGGVARLFRRSGHDRRTWRAASWRTPGHSWPG